jgi:hypothetical protein
MLRPLARRDLPAPNNAVERTAGWNAPHFAAHREELRVTSARYSAGLRIPSAEWGAWVL